MNTITRFSAAFLFFLVGSAFPQNTVSQLPADLVAGRVALVLAVGNGGSSGTTVEGALVNRTAITVHIDVNIHRPLYLVNGGSGQNMIATQVYLRGGAYETDGIRSFISLRPRMRTRIIFVAYCADFYRDNPTSSDTFVAGPLPPQLAAVSNAISEYSRLHPDADITVAAQVAVWLAQGIAPAKIKEKFPFTPADERLARSFIATGKVLN